MLRKVGRKRVEMFFNKFLFMQQKWASKKWKISFLGFRVYYPLFGSYFGDYFIILFLFSNDEGTQKFVKSLLCDTLKSCILWFSYNSGTNLMLCLFSMIDPLFYIYSMSQIFFYLWHHWCHMFLTWKL